MDTELYTESVTSMEYDVPDGETPAARCPYCERPFRTERAAQFHVGIRHEDVCTDDELAEYEEAIDDEEYDLFNFHLKAAVSIFLLYFLSTFFYALAWAGPSTFGE